MPKSKEKGGSKQDNISKLASGESNPALENVLNRLPMDALAALSVTSKKFKVSVGSENDKLKRAQFARHFPHLLESVELYHQIKKTKPNWVHEFGYAEQDEYINNKPREISLIRLAKDGDLEGLKKNKISMADLQILDYRGYRLLNWLCELNDQHILDYVYNKIVVPYFKNPKNTHDIDRKGILHYAIICNQSVETVQNLIPPDHDDLNRVIYRYVEPQSTCHCKTGKRKSQV